ncbi:MAG: polymer-forming cytoskeletal protein [Termitinemataceae bacterium]
MIKNTTKLEPRERKSLTERNKAQIVTTFGKDTKYTGFLKFKDTLRIQGRFYGTIEGQGDLIVDKDALVEVDRLSVVSLSVYGTVKGAIFALDRVDMFPGSSVQGDVTANRLRIADGVLFEGRCSMTDQEENIEIFSRPTEDIKADLQQSRNSK